MKFLVEATEEYKLHNITDTGLGRIPEPGEQWEVEKDRLDVLLGENPQGRVYVKLIKEVKVETPKKVEKKTKK